MRRTLLMHTCIHYMLLKVYTIMCAPDENSAFHAEAINFPWQQVPPGKGLTFAVSIFYLRMTDNKLEFHHVS